MRNATAAALTRLPLLLAVPAAGVFALACAIEPERFGAESSFSSTGAAQTQDAPGDERTDSSGGTTKTTSPDRGNSTGEVPTSSTGAAPSDTDPLDCYEVALPQGDLIIQLDASEAVDRAEGDVTQWTNIASPASSFTAQHNPPQRVQGVLGGRPVVRFDGQGQQLFANVEIDGLQELTIAMVSATTTLWYPDEEWCQTSFGLQMSEQGCSGTYNTPLMWDESGDWGFTFLGAGQEWISFRAGTGAKAYSDLETDPGVASLGYDPRVVWRRPTPIGDAFTRTTLVKRPSDFDIYVEDQRVYGNTLPEGTGPLMNVSSAVHLGGGRGDRYWGGDIAAVIVYARALSEQELLRLDRYLECRFFQVG